MHSFVWSKSYVQNSAQLTAILNEILLNRLIPKARGLSRQGKAIDLPSETQALSMDITSSYLCGLDAGQNFIENVDTRDFHLRAFKQSMDGIFWNEFPSIARWAGRIGVPLVPKVVHQSQLIIEELCSKMCGKAHRDIKELATDDARWPVVYGHLRPKLEKSCQDQEKVDTLMASEMLGFMIAGNDGAGNTICFLTWELSQHLEIQKELRHELASIQGIKSRAQAIDQLPLLDAVLMETIRLHPAGVGPHLRVAPKKGTQLGQYSNIPGGTTVSVTAWALHRNEDVFPQPEEWYPQRWMDESKRSAMRKWFFGFGAGSRSCIGNHLAFRGFTLSFENEHTNTNHCQSSKLM